MELTDIRLARHYVPLRLALAVLAIALMAVLGACGDPQVPVARSSSGELVEATSEPEPPTPTPPPTPTADTRPDDDPAPTPVPVRQPGLTADTIRLAVIFDDETQGAADQLFRDGWLGALAWANEVNESGGLGGRMVEVVPVDSRLFDHRSALEQVCEGDFFAIVGSHSLGDAEGAELLGTEDCNIADFPGQVYGSRRAASPVTFLSNPFLNDIRQAGPARFLVEQFPEESQNVGLLRYFDLDLANESERQREMLIAQGMQVVELPADLDEDPAERIVDRLDELGADPLVWTADPDRLIQLLSSLEERPSFVLCDWGCYSQQFILDGGDAVEGVYTWIAHDPFEGLNERGELILYRVNLASVSREARWSEVGFQSWLAGRLFEASFNALIAAEPEAPTREQLVRVAQATEFYTANGVLSATSPAEGLPTPCFVLMVVRDGRWEQEHPQPPRDKDCDEANLFGLVTSRSLGVATISAASSSEQTAPEAEPTPDLENPAEVDE